MSFSPHPSQTIEAHIWSDIIRKTVLQTNWSSEVIYITALLAYRTNAFTVKCGIYQSVWQEEFWIELNLPSSKLVTTNFKIKMQGLYVLVRDKKNKQTQDVVYQQKQHLTKCLNSVCCPASTWHPTMHGELELDIGHSNKSIVNTDPWGDQFAPSGSRPFNRVE